MVMGFNTEIKHEGLVFHIQTEQRKDAGLETAVYVKGAVIHRLKTSYRDLLDSPDYSEDKLKKRLEDQHRDVIGRIRGGEIGPPAMPSNPAPEGNPAE